MNKAIILSGSYPPRVCGVADQVYHLTRTLRAQAYDVEVWTTYGETPAAPEVRPIVTNWETDGIKQLVNDLKAAGPSVVHLEYERAIFHQSKAVCWLLPRLLRAEGIPLVTTFHSLDGPKTLGKAHRLGLLPLIYGSQQQIVCSARQEGALKRLPGIGSRARLIPLGTGVLPIADPAEARQRRRRAGGPLRLLYFGFVWRGRNIEVLLRSLAALPTEVTLDVVGGMRDVDYTAEIDRLAEELGVKQRVRFHGDLPAPVVSRFMLDSDAALLPFATGVSTGRSSFVAAVAHHLPVVTMTVPDNLSPHFRDGENMLLSPVGDDDAFLQSVTRLATEQDLLPRLTLGTAKLAEVFDWSAVARYHRELVGYRDLTPTTLEATG